MELVKNIFFNTDRLTANSIIKISYTGLFFQSNSESVYLHFGFGDNWENLSEIEMNKTDLGFQSEITLLDNNTLNLCFKNEKNEWDNNNSFNYIFNIEHQDLSLTLVDDKSLSLHRKLRKSYILSKKIKITLYKLLISIPKLISGNYKRNNN